MKKIQKVIFLILCVCILSTTMTVSLWAENESAEDQALEDFEEIIEGLPSDVKDKLPDSLADSGGENIGDGVLEMTNVTYLLEVLQDILGIELSSATRLFVALLGLIVIAGVFGVAKNSFGDSAMPTAIRFLSVSALMLTVIRTQYTCLSRVQEYFEQLNTVMLGMIPITGAVWALGGNVSTASVGTGTMYTFLNISQMLLGRTVIPMAAIGTCLAFCNGINPEVDMRKISVSLRKTYLFLIGAVVTVFGAVLSSQTTITAAADCATARTAKFISATVIPIVGGSVGDSLRTVASGVQYLKSVLGIGGIALIFLGVLPVLISLILTRFVLSFSAGVANFFGCVELGGVLGELSEVYSGIIAAVAMTGVMFILSLFIFIKTAVAIM